MAKHEPKIIAGDLSNEELLQWMQGKIQSAQHLKEALSLKEYHEKALEEVSDRIEMLASLAALELSDTTQESRQYGKNVAELLDQKRLERAKKG
ncbi:hypothetical protein [Ewingella americana]|uniref:hypothetical protein n=1 Tax=Ewingella americana TaxID=41202 RepID=UPI00163AA2F8|nr:hypothetical protein [Ewingella americana]QMV54105.1 hypothetical protein GXP68_22870 [Ewingella americana]